MTPMASTPNLQIPTKDKKIPDNGSQSSKTGPTFDDESVEETEIESKDPLPDSIRLKIDHVRQRFFWDCGISCILMLLPLEERTYFLNNFEQICQEEAFGTSAWTIDLCYLLKRFGIKHTMHTSMIGVNEDYQNFTYYQNQFHLDRPRVQRRFDEAEANGIKITEGIVTTLTLKRHLAKHGPIILLVDAGLLTCDLCKHNKLRSEFRRCFGGNFRGHYILLVGYSTFGKSDMKFLYQDPDLKPSLCASSVRSINEARFSSGTDNDMIFIYNHNSS